MVEIIEVSSGEGERKQYVLFFGCYYLALKKGDISDRILKNIKTLKLINTVVLSETVDCFTEHLQTSGNMNRILKADLPILVTLSAICWEL